MRFTVIFLFIFLLFSPSFAAEPVPGGACATAGAFTNASGPEAGGNAHMMVCNSGVWKSVMDYSTSTGRSLIQLDTDNGSCTALKTGRLRYNNGGIDICNGTIWKTLESPPSCSDMTPAAFAFTDQLNAAQSTVYTSNIVQITSIDCAVATILTGSAGDPQQRICANSDCSTIIQDWTNSNLMASNGNYIQLRMTSSGAAGVDRMVTLTAGLAYAQWAVRTSADCTGSVPIGTVCADGSVYAGLSPDGNVKMYAMRCDAGQVMDTGGCTGTRITKKWGNGTVNPTTGVNNGTTGKANTAALAVLYNTGYPYAAAQYCHDLEQHGQTDWYLPALGELNVLYTSRAPIGGFPTTGTVSHWSSTEYTSTVAYFTNLVTGQAYIADKNDLYYIRCVRR